MAWRASDASLESGAEGSLAVDSPRPQETAQALPASGRRRKKGSLSTRPFSAVTRRHMRKVRKQHELLETPPNMPNAMLPAENEDDDDEDVKLACRFVAKKRL